MFGEITNGTGLSARLIHTVRNRDEALTDDHCPRLWRARRESDDGHENRANHRECRAGTHCTVRPHTPQKVTTPVGAADVGEAVRGKRDAAGERREAEHLDIDKT